MSNIYIAVQTPDGGWTIEWSVRGVVLGHVAGPFRYEMEALIGVYERTRAELLRSLERETQDED